MSAAMVRGYWLLSAVAYIERRSGRQAREQLSARLPRDVKSGLDGILPGTWCPRDALSEALRSVVQTSTDSPSEALRECGREAAVLACETFLKVVIGLMTPSMLLKKTPVIWAIDHERAGVLDVEPAEPGDQRGRASATQVGGFYHLGPAYAGWLGEALRRTGAANARVEHEGWSLAAPAPDSITWTATW